MGKHQKCQSGVRDLDLENEVKVRRSWNFNWPYLGQFSTQTALRHVSRKFGFDLSTLTFGKMPKIHTHRDRFTEILRCNLNVLRMTLNCLHQVIYLSHPGANDLSCWSAVKQQFPLSLSLVIISNLSSFVANLRLKLMSCLDLKFWHSENSIQNAQWGQAQTHVHI